MAEGITAPQGFEAAAVHCGIGKGEKPDLALVYSHRRASAAGLFTTNRVRAAPVEISRKHLSDGTAQAIIATSGNANACTGKQGLRDALRMARETGEALGVRTSDVLVASTGVIGVRLPVEKVVDGIARAGECLSRSGGRAAAEAIMTTDTRLKQAVVRARIDGREITIGGMAKGAGMIAPNLATMLAFLTTDASIERRALRLALEHAAARSFNSISIDGDMSTNDTLLILANGEAGNKEVRAGQKSFAPFSHALDEAARSLATQIVMDGEGATKFVTVRVAGARTAVEAKLVAGKVANSLLVKTALFGGDPNWGRIMAAVGASGVNINPNSVSVTISGLRVASRGEGADYDEAEAAARMKQREIELLIELQRGKKEATVWTSDLTDGYIRINAHYRT